jgi:hypothetical protein
MSAVEEKIFENKCMNVIFINTLLFFYELYNY